ncbi:hypothetical protein MPL1032_60035 [Mesorhizobium plurifarium]|uniref:Uncharacterized protein n=1 Tax=Mesorhizobium plurifarium TaxID=69974 RepID=A0A0K2W6I2_MESPL|nr:hypothetical protein MPL1032_60035 [Mesorhizobium plurifarium]
MLRSEHQFSDLEPDWVKAGGQAAQGPFGRPLGREVPPKRPERLTIGDGAPRRMGYDYPEKPHCCPQSRQLATISC